MIEQPTDESEQSEANQFLRFPKPSLPSRYIAVTLDTRESEFHACGENRLRGVFGEEKIPRDVVVALTQRCYTIPAGARTKLHLTFFEGKEKVKPKGKLVIDPKRGKVSPLRIDLDGTKHEVVVDYTAPDETIQVSVRAYLAGFMRGKVHLHLEA